MLRKSALEVISFQANSRLGDKLSEFFKQIIDFVKIVEFKCNSKDSKSVNNFLKLIDDFDSKTYGTFVSSNVKRLLTRVRTISVFLNAFSQFLWASIIKIQLSSFPLILVKLNF